MQITFTGHHLDITPPLKDFTMKKLNRLEHHFSDVISIALTFKVENLDQIAEATVHIPGSQIHVREKTDDMYSAIDGLIDKLMRKLKDHKERNH